MLKAEPLPDGRRRLRRDLDRQLGELRRRDALVRRDLLLTKAVSVIDGTVEQAGVPQVGAFVLLMPKNPAQRWAYRVDQTDTDGSYRLATIPSGDYFLIALTQGEDVAYRDLKVAAILAKDAKQIHVEPSEQLDMKLDVVATPKIPGT